MPAGARESRLSQIEAWSARQSRWSFEGLPAPAQVWWQMFVGLGFLFVARVVADGAPTMPSIAVASGWISIVLGAFGARRGLPDSVCGFLVVIGNVLLIGRYVAGWMSLWLVASPAR
jgi:hypothetical protein